ncbi:hypothetical protein PR048_019765 [Dryococelus australis]|uniref:Uncharacterized protein n=1 Tax=Dryococelus australis TaxID=614101 RepID=A0ABQ9H4G6_9NEOP|nr:hypothetical protein PR048_019765 [Dryococelus australis]
MDSNQGSSGVGMGMDANTAAMAFHSNMIQPAGHLGTVEVLVMFQSLKSLKFALPTLSGWHGLRTCKCAFIIQTPDGMEPMEHTKTPSYPAKPRFVCLTFLPWSRCYSVIDSISRRGPASDRKASSREDLPGLRDKDGGEKGDGASRTLPAHASAILMKILPPGRHLLPQDRRPSTGTLRNILASFGEPSRPAANSGATRPWKPSPIARRRRSLALTSLHLDCEKILLQSLAWLSENWSKQHASKFAGPSQLVYWTCQIDAWVLIHSDITLRADKYDALSFGVIFSARLSCVCMRWRNILEAELKQGFGKVEVTRRNEVAGEMVDPRENLPTNGIVWHDSHLRKSCDLAGY